MPGINANKVEFIFNPLKYFSLGENFKINCKIDSTVQQHVVEVKVDNVSSKKTIEGLDVDIFPLEFVGEISVGNHSINIAIYEEDEVIGRMFYPCITVYDYNDYSIQYITDNNDKNPYISTYYIEPIVNINEEWEIEIFVDDFYCSGYRNLNIGDEKIYEIHVEIDDKHIIYDNLSHGNHFIKMPALSEYKVYDFILYAKDNLGYESHVLINEVWVKPEIEENIYQMTEDDLVAYGITNKKVENIVPIYCNEEEYNAIMAVAKNSRYLTRNEILSSKDEVVNYNIPNGEYVCFIPDFNNDGEYDPFDGWLYKEQYTRYAEDYNIEEIYNMAESNRIGLQQFIDDKIEEGYTTVKLIENGYFIVNDLVQLNDANNEQHPGSIIIEGANNFTLDLNGATIKMNANANATSKIVTLSASFNSHVKNGIIDGDVFTHDYDNSTNNSEWNMIAGIHGDCRYCSFENLTMSHSSGYGYVGGGGHILRNGVRLYTSYLINCPTFVYGDIDDNGDVIESNDRSISDFVDISTAITKYKSFYGEDIKYIRGQISRYLGYQGNGLCNWNLKVFMYDENKNLIHKRVGYQYREVDIPVNTKYIRVVALADYNLFDVGTGIKLVHFFRPINCVTKNVTIKEIRGTGGAWTSSNNCLFTDMEFRSVGNHVTPTAFDFEDGWDQMQDVTMRNIKCFSDGGGSTALMTCGGHNFIYENIGHDSEAYAYNYARTRHYVYRNCVSNNKFAQNYQSIIRTGTPRMYNCDIKTFSNNTNPDIITNFKSDHIDRGTIYNSTVKNHIINNYSSIISTCDIINSNVICNGWSGYIGRKAYFVNDRFICEDENNFIDIAINTGGNVIMYDCTFDSFTRFRNHTDLSLLYVENCSFPKGVAIEPNVIERSFQKDIMFKKCNMTIDSLEYNFIDSKPYAYSAGPVKVTFEDCVITIKDIGPNKSIWYDNSKSTEGVIKFINCKFIFETEDKIGLFTTSASNKLGRTNLLVKMIKCEMIDDITKTTVKNTEGIKYFETNTDEIIIDTNQPRLIYLNNEDVIIPYCSVSSNDGFIETHGVIKSLTDEEFNNINIDNYNVDQGYINDSISSNALPLGEYQYEVYSVDSYGLRSEPLTMNLTVNEYIEENDFTEIVVDIPTDNYELVLIGSSELIINTGEINWGDGTEDILTTDNLSHIYATAGEYTIRGRFIFGKGIKPTNTIKNVLIKVNKLCSNYSLNLNSAFEGMTRLETFNCDNIRVDNLANTFYSCNALTTLDVSNWDTSNVTNMSHMFGICKLLTSVDVSNWDTSNVTDMSYMFYSCNALTTLDVSKWDTSNVTNMSWIFRGCNALTSLDVSNWDTSKVTSMNLMFIGCHKLTTLDVSKWDTSNVTNMSEMFHDCKSLTTLDLSNWDTKNVIDMSSMFRICNALTSVDVSNWNTSKVTTMGYMFYGCSALTTLDVSKWDTSNVTDMNGMFYGCKSLTSLDVSNWDTSNVTNMNCMFRDCNALTSLDLTNWNTSNVTDMRYMFQYNYALTTLGDLFNWDTVNVARTNNMFYSCTALTTLDVSNWNISKVNDISTMFCNCSALTSLDVSKWDVSNITKMNGMFNGCSALTSLDVSKWDTSNVTDMSSIFQNCNALTTLDVSNWNTNNVLNMGGIFQNCNALTTLDVSNWNTKNVNNMYGIFFGCKSLTSLDISKWNTSNVTDMRFMFRDCRSLTTLDISNFDLNKVNTYYSGLFLNGNKLLTINMKYSDYNSVNKIIEQLPTRTSDSTGTLDIEGVDDHRLVNKSEAELRHWVIMTVFPNIKYYTLANEAGETFTYPIINSDESVLSNSSISLNAIENEGSDETILCIEIETQEDINSIQFVNPEYLLKMLILDTSNMTTMKDLFKNCTQLNSIECSDWDTSNVTDMQGMFYNCNNLTTLDLSNFDTSNVTSMNNMIRGCHSLTSLDVSNFNTSNVTSMSNMFNYCQSLTSLDVSNFNTSKVTNMSTMFYGCQSLTSLDVSNFDTNNVTIMNDMFNYCKSLTSLDLSNFNTSKVTNMSNMFANCESLTSLVLGNGFNMDNVTNIAYIFSGCNNLILLIVPNATVSMKLDDHLPTRTADSPGTLIVTGDKYNLDIKTPESKYWNISDIYKIAEYKFNSSINTLFSEVNDGFVFTHNDIDNGDGTITRTIYSDQLPTIIRFEDCEGLLELLYLNTSELTTLRKSFKNCYNVTSINATDWDISKVTSLYEAFEDCNNLTTLDVSNWDTSNVTDMLGIFDNCQSLTTLDVSNWDTSNVVNMNGVFRDCYSLTSLDVSNWNTNNVTDMDGMFNDCRLLTELDLSNFDTSKVTTMYQMFCDCYSLTSVDLSNFDTANVINMSAMFDDCQSLTSLDVSNFDTSKVTNMSEMFFACKSLTTLDLSNFDTSKVTDMQWMFGFYDETGNEAMALTSIAGLGNWDTTNVTNMYCMFCNCRNLTTLDISNWDVSNVTNMNSMFYNCNNLTTLDVSNWDTSNVTDMDDMFDSCTNLISIIMNNSDYSSVNKVIAALPTRTTDSPGTLNMAGIDDISQVDTTTAESKFWTIENKYLIAQYKFDNTLYDLIPEFNEGFAYTYEDVVDGEVTIRTIYSYSLPTLMRFGTNTLYANDYVEGSEVALISIDYLDTSNLTTCYNMFKRCTSLVSINTDGWNTSNVTTMQSMFAYCSQLTTLNVEQLNTTNVTNMKSMFDNCTKLTTLDVSKWDTGNVTDMAGMFFACQSLTQLDVSNFDTSNVTDMSYMFYLCFDLEHLDVSNWDVSKVTDMSSMFYCCDSLSELDFSRWDVSNVTNMELLFCNCCSFTQNTVNGLRNWDVSNVENMYAMIDCLCLNGVTTIDLSGWDVSKVTNMDGMLEYNTELKYLNLNNWILNENVDTTELLKKSNNLEKVLIMNSNAFTINKIIEQLPTRTTDSMGTLNVAGVDDISQVNTATAESKYWNIVDKYKIAEYKFDNTVYDLIPEFNAEFTDYTYEDIVDGEITTRTIYSDSLPTKISFGQGNTEAQPRELSLLGVEYLNITNTTKIIYNLFARCQNLQYVNGVNDWDISGISDLTTVFYYCKSLTSLDLSNWDTSNVTNMYCMFRGCESLTSLDFSNWDTGNVTYMNYMFADCPSLTTLDVSNFDTNSVTDMSWMFYKCQSLTSLDVSNWDTSNVTDMYAMFAYCNELTSVGDLSNWDTSNVTDMCGMFYKCNNLTSLDVSNFDTKNVTDMDSMFFNCESLTSLDVSNFDTSNVTNMDSMFNNCTNLASLDVSNFDTSNVTNMEYMFCGCNNLTTLDVSNFNTSNVTNMEGMFSYCTSLTLLDMSNFNTTNVTNMEGMFSYCNNLTQLDVSNFNTSNVNNMSGMFYDCQSLSSLDVSNFNTSNVEDMIYMFYNCTNLTLLNLSSFNTSKVSNMEGMFFNCTSLTSLDVSSFNTSKVSNMEGMFINCNNLTSLDVSNWDTSNVTNMTYMFGGCNNLNNVKMQNSDYNSVNKIIAQLPTRTTDSPGTLNIAGIDDINQVNINDAKTKFWIINNPEKIKSIKINNKNINKIYKGLLKIKKVYLG